MAVCVGGDISHNSALDVLNRHSTHRGNILRGAQKYDVWVLERGYPLAKALLVFKVSKSDDYAAVPLRLMTDGSINGRLRRGCGTVVTDGGVLRRRGIRAVKRLSSTRRVHCLTDG